MRSIGRMPSEDILGLFGGKDAQDQIKKLINAVGTGFGKRVAGARH